MLTPREQYLKYRISSGVYFTSGLLQNEGVICLCVKAAKQCSSVPRLHGSRPYYEILKESLKNKIGRDLSPNEILYGFLTKDPKLRLASKVIAKFQSILARARFKNHKISTRIAEVALKEYHTPENIFKDVFTQ
ncbi:Hypothetical protein FKW44_006165 [Caligus rogercresseyi]|uniref:Uncharacterized protein n=1 Tax=Caligus rogercresseyi TaxID=217165 RepID=A0A7T8QSP0_CALRO|nr:Hypothetical protein FKW44_006165 [Caligus rogercresseyi]